MQSRLKSNDPSRQSEACLVEHLQKEHEWLVIEMNKFLVEFLFKEAHDFFAVAKQQIAGMIFVEGSILFQFLLLDALLVRIKLLALWS